MSVGDPHKPMGGEHLARIADLCRLGVRRMGVDGMSANLSDPFRVLTAVFATDEVAEQVVRLQDVLGQGPSIDTLGSGLPTMADDLDVAGQRARWPLFVPDALALGVHAVHAFPLTSAGERLGTVEVYRRARGY